MSNEIIDVGFEKITDAFNIKKALKIVPGFKGAVLAIIKLETSRVEWQTKDVVEESRTRTMYRHFDSVAALAAFSQELKQLAKEEIEKKVTTKFSLVTCFAQDDHGQVIGVEKYGAYGLQAWKEPDKKDD